MPTNDGNNLDAAPYNNRERIGAAIEAAKAKNARLRLLKERNENYLAERKDADDELMEELAMSQRNR
jgi:hypothetical protein